jgi:hypothetical protein
MSNEKYYKLAILHSKLGTSSDVCEVYLKVTGETQHIEGLYSSHSEGCFHYNYKGGGKVKLVEITKEEYEKKNKMLEEMCKA